MRGRIETQRGKSIKIRGNELYTLRKESEWRKEHDIWTDLYKNVLVDEHPVEVMGRQESHLTLPSHVPQHHTSTVFSPQPLAASP